MEEILRDWAEQRGYKIVWFPGAWLELAQQRLARMQADGEFDSAFFSQHLAWLQDPGIAAQVQGRSLILVATPRPAHLVNFHHQGKQHELIIPPTYVNYSGWFKEVQQDLQRFLPSQIHLEILKAPLKTLAALSGLTRFGRNNLAYADGFGSYFQLVGLTVDLPLDDAPVDTLAPPASLPECQKCRACLEACPSRAISDTRFLLHAERCLTLFSENPGYLPEIYSQMKNRCLIGCLACQECCPKNRGLLQRQSTGLHFTSAETAWILEGPDAGTPPPELVANFNTLKMNELFFAPSGPNSILHRNLTLLLGGSMAVFTADT